MIIIIFFVLASLWLCPARFAALPVVTAPAPIKEVVQFPYYRVPDNVYLCGEPVPLNDPLVREDLDRELTIVVWSRAQTTMWLKRANRYLPEVDAKLRARGLPLDLRYVVIIESDLRPMARSSAGALGPWQFIAPTAQRFQLKCNTALDERLEFSAATDAALNYLRDLYQTFHNWPLALAAYNCGEGRVQKALALQGVKTFYHLSLPEETERYVLRLVAAKIVMEDPVHYGYDIPADQLYAPLQYDEVNITLLKGAPVRRLADACGSYYKLIKTLNPWIKGAVLTAGTYRLRVPQGTGSRFEEAYRRGQLEENEGEKGKEAKKVKGKKKK